MHLCAEDIALGDHHLALLLLALALGFGIVDDLP